MGARSGKFALFAEMLLVGLFTAVAAVPVVTAYVAFTAGCSVLRDVAFADRGAGLIVYWARLREVARSGAAGFVVPPVLVALLALDGLAVAAGVPGRPFFAVPLVLVGAVSAVLGLRTAARWRPGSAWPAVAGAAARDLARDPGGSALLLLAFSAALGVAVTVPITALLLPGALALAAVAVDARAAR